jgi:beta-galactosidase
MLCWLAAVHVDATHPDGWWYDGGGMYRGVQLRALSPVHVLAPDDLYLSHAVHGDPAPSGNGILVADVTLKVSPAQALLLVMGP